MKDKKVVVIGGGSFARAVAMSMANMAPIQSDLIEAISHAREQLANMSSEIIGLELSSQPVTYRLHDHSMPKMTGCYVYSDPRFNAEPEKSTFTRKINRSTKRW